MSAATFELLFGIIFALFGIAFGATAWWHSHLYNHVASAGTVMLAALPLLAGVQLLISFLNYDMGTLPKQSLSSMKLPDDHSITSN